MGLQPTVGLLLGVELKTVALAVDPAINDPANSAIVHLIFHLHATRKLRPTGSNPSGINSAFLPIGMVGYREV